MKAVRVSQPAKAQAHSYQVTIKTRWLRAVRMLSALLLVLQISGAGLLFSTLAGAQEAGCSEHCVGDDERAQCPPTCPSCTCVHAAWSGLPTASRPTMYLGYDGGALLLLPPLHFSPINPDPAGIFRPPRG